MTTSEHLLFLDTVVRLDIDDDALPLIDDVRRFFRHLLSGSHTGDASFTVSVSRYLPDAHVPASIWDTKRTEIRRSTAPEFTFSAHLDRSGGRCRYINRAMLLDAPDDVRADPHFHVGVSSNATIQMIDFLRDLILRNQEQLGTPILHAAGVHDGTRAIAIAGPKSAGKTTSLLALLRTERWSYFTGDRMFCRVTQSGIEAHPWRDWPHLGVGTLRREPWLLDRVRRYVDADVDRSPVGRKILIDPDLFESWVDSPFSAAPRFLGAIMLPRVEPGEPLRVHNLHDDGTRRARLLGSVERQADTTFFGWQSYLVPDYVEFFTSMRTLHRRVRPLPMFEVSGDVTGGLGRALAAQLGRAPESSRRRVLQVAVVGPSGAGKSTFATVLQQLATSRDYSSARVRLATPLYNLQKLVYEEAGVHMSEGEQDQGLMEQLAEHLRRIRPTAIIDHLLHRLEQTDAQVIITEDLRDPVIDAPTLRRAGFRFVRVVAPDHLRDQRRGARGDLTQSDRSTTALDKIPVDATLVNDGSLNAYEQAVGALVRSWL